MITVEYHEGFCIVRYGEIMTAVPKSIGEAIEKLQIDNRQLKIKLEEKV